MPVFTKKQPEADVAVAVAPVLSVEDALRQVEAKITEMHRLNQVLAGEVRTTTMESVERTVYSQQGHARRVSVEEPVTVSRTTTVAERIRAELELPGAKVELRLAQERLEEAKAVHATATRARQEQAIVAGLETVKRELPGLLKDLKAVQARMIAFSETMGKLDAELGRRYFQEAVWPYMLPNEGLDFFVAYVTETFVKAR